MNNKKNITKKLANVFINLGNLHTNSVSLGLGFYEPKIPIKSSNKKN